MRKMHLSLLLPENLHQGRDHTGCQAEILKAGLELEMQRCFSPFTHGRKPPWGAHILLSMTHHINLQGSFVSKGEVSLASKPTLVISTLTFLEKCLIIHLLHYGELQLDNYSNWNDVLTLRWCLPQDESACQPVTDPVFGSQVLKKPREHQDEQVW